MKFYLFAPARILSGLEKTRVDLRSILETIAADTDTRDLVVALHLRTEGRWYGGTAYVRAWVTPRQFYAGRGKWRLSSTPPLPIDLPLRFKLIRMALPADDTIYPLVETDSYHWRHHYKTFADHLAFIFAHELHHFRRFHLQFHPHEGEHSANAWALQHVRAHGFNVNSEKPTLRKHRRHSRTQPSFIHLLNPSDYGKKGIVHDWPGVVRQILADTDEKTRKRYMAEKLSHLERLRKLPVGSEVWICFDPSRKYLHQQVRILRPLRRNSYRLVVETADGKMWRWPITWLSEQNPMTTSG